MDNHTGAAPTNSAEDALDRRDFVSVVSALAMGGGLLAGYGTLAAMAGRFLYQQTDDSAWLFVAPVDAFLPGESRPFESPVGVRAVVTRQASPSAADQPATVEEFIALSSVCPHLGCRVHWESQNHRYFCPCHNGTFDADGKATGGPPLAAGQSLPKYPLKIERGMLFIWLPVHTVGDTGRPAVAAAGCPRRIGHALGIAGEHA